MTKYLTGSLLLLFTVISSFGVLAQQPDVDQIPWSPERPLTWEDYLGAPDPSSDAAAITSTYLGIDYKMRNGAFSYKISCQFSKSRSWGRHRSKEILAHEQGHFDITEIFARRLHQEMKGYVYNKNTYATVLKDLYQKVMQEKERWQNAYDLETDHSIKKDVQLKWEKKIADELVRLAEFANY